MFSRQSNWCEGPGLLYVLHLPRQVWREKYNPVIELCPLHRPEGFLQLKCGMTSLVLSLSPNLFRVFHPYLAQSRPSAHAVLGSATCCGPTHMQHSGCSQGCARSICMTRANCSALLQTTPRALMPSYFHSGLLSITFQFHYFFSAKRGLCPPQHNTSHW